ncbi:MAG: PDZ domain-containing protein, partial [Clostridia bacterium]|nr:PDZ domain-containing protein [Clostridia bacterium]
MFFKNFKRKKFKPQNHKTTRFLLSFAGVICTMLLAVNAFFPREVSVGTTKIDCCLIPSGQAVGMRFKTKGVMVVGVEPGNLPAQKAGVKNGDVITKVNDVPLQNTRHFEEILRSIGENTVTLTILREDKTLHLEITPRRNRAKQLICGMWLRDSAAGIGTVTFFTEDKKQ